MGVSSAGWQQPLMPGSPERRPPEQYDVVIAGAGPAGLGCARAITEGCPDLKVLLLEAGRSSRHRPCPVDRGLRCTGCGGVCNVVSGFGGSMHYGDGAKLSLLPSGRRLVDLFGAAEAQRLCGLAFGWLTESLDPSPDLLGRNLSDGVLSAFGVNALSIREYPVAVLGESQLRSVIDGSQAALEDRVVLRHMAEVADAAPAQGGGLLLTVRQDGGRYVQVIRAEHLVLATGRRGVTSSTELLRGLGVATELPDISVGVRVEMAAPLLGPIGEEHPDLKITQLDNARKVKTFCFCGGPNGGRIKFTNYQDAFGDPVITLDGHETMERLAGDRLLAANFGLLCQVQQRGNAIEARDSFLATYRRLAAGRPFAQTLRAFLERRDDSRTWGELEAAMPFQPSVLDLTVGRVDALFTAPEHLSLAAGFRRLMASILAHSGNPVTLEALLDNALVIGPELEFLWEKPSIDPACRVPDRPVYVVGDSAGLAQGIVQAAMMGIAAGEDIVRRSTVPVAPVVHTAASR